jgi:hypothetical protein
MAAGFSRNSNLFAEEGMERHIKILAILHVVHGALIILTEYITLWLLGKMGLLFWPPHRLLRYGRISHVELTEVLVPIFYCVIVAPILIAIPGIIGGWGLYQRKNWARIVVLIVGIIILVNFPVGTALGIYTIWVVFQPETVKLTTC